MIDHEEVETENNKAEKQCQDNVQAFHHYKKNQLFPSSTKLPQYLVDKKRNKAKVGAYKSLEKSVLVRNPRRKGNRGKIVYGNAPYEYPHIPMQLEEKQKLRKLNNNLEMNKYLSDSDSGYDSF